MLTSELLPNAILWDLDGTIIDSEEYWITAERELAAEFGGVWTHEDGMVQVGQGLPVTAAALQLAGVQIEIPKIIERLGNRVNELLEIAVPWRPGAVDLLQQVAEAGIPQGMVTMSVRPIALRIASLVPGVHFSTVVSGDVVSHQKPHPAPYSQAAREMSADIKRCIALEDSPSGMTSAWKAGAFVVGIRHLVDIDAAPHHVILDTLSGVSAEQLVGLFQHNVGPRLIGDIS